MKKRLFFTILGLVLVFGGIFGYKWFVAYKTAEFFANQEAPVQTVTATIAEPAAWQPTIKAVGSLEAQRAFVAELCRVGRRVFVTTPNRWFPVEHHTGLPLLHFLPGPIFRCLLRFTPFSYWSHEAHLRILTARELGALFPATRSVRVEHAGVGVGIFASNLIAFARPSESSTR